MSSGKTAKRPLSKRMASACTSIWSDSGVSFNICLIFKGVSDSETSVAILSPTLSLFTGKAKARINGQSKTKGRY